MKHSECAQKAKKETTTALKITSDDARADRKAAVKAALHLVIAADKAAEAKADEATKKFAKVCLVWSMARGHTPAEATAFMRTLRMEGYDSWLMANMQPDGSRRDTC